MSDDRLVIAHRSLEAVSPMGTICAALIVLTGVVNGLILVGLGNIGVLFDTIFCQLLMLKLRLDGVMLLAVKNGWRLTPALSSAVSDGSGKSTIAALHDCLLIEAATGFLILGLGALLGTLEPATNSKGS